MTIFHNNNGKTYHILDAWESYTDGMSNTELNDLLWFESENLFSLLEIYEADDEDDDDFDSFL